MPQGYNKDVSEDVSEEPCTAGPLLHSNNITQWEVNAYLAEGCSGCHFRSHAQPTAHSTTGHLTALTQVKNVTPANQFLHTH